MFLEDGCIFPATGAIEFRDHWGAFRHAHLIDAVFIAVQCQQAAIGFQPGGFQRIEDAIGRERRVGVRVRKFVHAPSILAAMPLFETFSLLFLCLLAWLWHDSLQARDAGVREARTACSDEGLQLLDDTVAIRSLRFARDDGGRLRLQRVYGFEYSDTGDNRREGSVTLLGHDVVMVSLRARLTLIGGGRHEQH